MFWTPCKFVLSMNSRSIKFRGKIIGTKIWRNGWTLVHKTYSHDSLRYTSLLRFFRHNSVKICQFSFERWSYLTFLWLFSKYLNPFWSNQLMAQHHEFFFPITILKSYKMQLLIQIRFSILHKFGFFQKLILFCLKKIIYQHMMLVYCMVLGD